MHALYPKDGTVFCERGWHCLANIARTRSAISELPASRKVTKPVNTTAFAGIHPVHVTQTSESLFMRMVSSEKHLVRTIFCSRATIRRTTDLPRRLRVLQQLATTYFDDVPP